MYSFIKAVESLYKMKISFHIFICAIIPIKEYHFIQNSTVIIQLVMNWSPVCRCLCVGVKNIRDNRIPTGLQGQAAAVKVFDCISAKSNTLCPVTRGRWAGSELDNDMIRDYTENHVLLLIGLIWENKDKNSQHWGCLTCILLLLVVCVDSSSCAVLSMASHCPSGFF